MQPQFQQQPQMQMEFDHPGAFDFFSATVWLCSRSYASTMGFEWSLPTIFSNLAFGMQSNQWLSSQQPGFQQQVQWQQHQHQQNMGGDVASKSKNSAKETKKLVAAQQNQYPSIVSATAARMSYTSSICMCCGEPGHHQASCVKIPMCFICKTTNHLVCDCPVRKRPHQMAMYVGSGAPDLGFYHIKIPEDVINPVGSTKNCGIVIIEEGELSREELYSECAKIYKTN
jgi:hypothetical protein